MMRRALLDLLTLGDSRRRFLERLTSALLPVVRGGLPIGPALLSLASDEDWSHREVVEEVGRSVIRGARLSEALARQPAVFDPGYRSAIAAGEAASDLAASLESILRELRQRGELGQALRAAARYPSMVVLALIGSLTIMGWLVVPAFIAVLESNDDPAPAWIRLFLAGVRCGPFVIVPGVLLLLVTNYLAAAGRIGGTTAQVLSRMRFRIPIIGEFQLHVVRAAACRSLAAQLDARVRFDEALLTVSQHFSDHAVKAELEARAADVAAGRSMLELADRRDIFDGLTASFLELAWGKGNFPGALRRLADSEDRAVANFLRGSLLWLESTLLALIAALCLLAISGQFKVHYDSFGRLFPF